MGILDGFKQRMVMSNIRKAKEIVKTMSPESCMQVKDQTVEELRQRIKQFRHDGEDRFDIEKIEKELYDVMVMDIPSFRDYLIGKIEGLDR